VAPANLLEFFMTDLSTRESARSIMIAALLTLVVIGSASAFAFG